MKNGQSKFPKLEFLGAADTVTGSRSLITCLGERVLIDCGLFQGHKEMRERNRKRFDVDPNEIDSVVLTHAHLDHSGYIPRLVRSGYRGPIYCSQGTFELCQLLLKDAAYLEEEFAAFANKTKYSHHDPAIPLFTREDAEKALEQFKPIDRHSWFPVASSINVRLHRGGHIPGASMVECSFEGDGPQRIVFSGDLGNDRLATMRAPEAIPPCEILVLESTYGDRLQSREDVSTSLAEIINKTVKRDGVLVIPAFAVGRSQEVVYLIKKLEDQGLIPKVPVILDSPMAISATSLFLRHPEDHRLDVLDSTEDELFKPALFETSNSTDDSLYTVMRDGPMIVISAAGMLNGGRILHHLKRRLPDWRNTILFAGYQAEGTKGRFLQDLAKDPNRESIPFRIHHEEVPVKASIETLTTLSSHADYQDILEAIQKMSEKPKKIILNHGTPSAQQNLKSQIQASFQIPVFLSNEIRDFKLFCPQDPPAKNK